jgi:hypothetical protein
MKNKEVLNLFAGLGGNRKKWGGINRTNLRFKILEHFLKQLKYSS